MMRMSSDLGFSSSKDQAVRDISEYESYHKGYKTHAEDLKDSEQIDQYNEDLKSKYDLDPRVF